VIKRALAACAALLWAPLASADPAEISPALYVVRDADSTLYLYGTVHALPEGSAWGNAAVRAALEEADEVWTESNFYDEALQQQFYEDFVRGLETPAAAPLTQRLPLQARQRLLFLAKSMGLGRDVIDAMEPWEAALFLTGVEASEASAAAGVDQQVINAALARGAPTRWLEDASVATFEALPEAVHMEFLLWMLENVESDFAAGEALWREGDLEALYESEIAPMQSAYPNLYNWIVVERNAAWMEILLREMDASGVDFVAVGSAHLGGPHSLKAMFEEHGYVVERVTPQP